MNDVGNPNNDTYTPPPDRRRPPNSEIVDRIERVENELKLVKESFENELRQVKDQLSHALFALGIDDPTDPKAWRQLGQEHGLIRAQRSFCEKVGWNVVWIAVAFVGLIGLSNLEHLRKLAGIK